MLLIRVKCLLIFVVLSLVSLNIYAQTQVTGIIKDAKTKEIIPFAVVVFKEDKGTGVTADADGRFTIKTSANVKNIEVSFIGYETSTIAIKPAVRQTVEVKLRAQNNVLETATIKANREKYSNKNNPAVDLLRKVIESKEQNRIQFHDYYQYDKYEKLELALNNFRDSSENLSGFLKQADFIFHYVDTSELTGQRVLPFYFREIASEVYYKKNPPVVKEIVKAERNVDIHHFVDMNSVNTYVETLFNPIDLYDNDVFILQVKFMSPLSPMAPTFFKYHILDTLKIQGIECIKLTFFPRNTSDLAFSGDVYVVNDSSYAVKRIDLRTPKNTGINFVRNFSLRHTYSRINDTWNLTEDKMSVEFVLSEESKGSLLGTRTASHRNFVFNQPASESIYKGVAKVVKLPGSDQQSPLDWEVLRHDSLSRREAGVFTMIDSLKQVPLFKFTLNALTMIFSGYTQVGKFDIGPVVSFYSFNSLEGSRFRFGGKTNANLNPHWFGLGYAAYGTKDKVFKYSSTLMYSVNKRKEHPWEFPMNLFALTYEYDAKIPGQAFMYGSGDKLLLSFRRGPAEKVNYEKRVELYWNKEHLSGFSLNPAVKWLEQDPQQDLMYINGFGERVKKIATTQASLGLRFAPNERFYQDQMNRFPVDPSNPIFGIRQIVAIENLFGGDYALNRTEAHFDKRIWFTGLGYADVWLKAGKIWNTGVPFPLLIIPQANQNYAYQDEAYNLMNFMEFVTDQYASANLSYCFNGLLFNRIPLLKKLKFREYITFKAIWGSLDNKNNPEYDKTLFQFPDRTFPLLGNVPYMEASFAVDNIFKVLRIDLIRRLSYLNHEDIVKWGITFRIRPSF